MMLDAPLGARRRSRSPPRLRRAGPPQDHRRRRASGACGRMADLKPYMTAHWWDYLQTYGTRRRHGMGFEPYPKSAPRACRRDAWPETGGAPGSDLDLIRAQYLDRLRHRVRHPGPARRHRPERDQPRSRARPSPLPSMTGSAISSPGREPRLRSAIVVPYEDGEASAREIERCADDPAFAQVFMLTRSSEPPATAATGRSTKPPQRHGLPVGTARVRRQRPSLHGRRLAVLSTSKRAPAIPPRARRSSPASSSRACSSASRSSRW